MATEFGKRLRQARELAGFKQEELAKIVGMSQSTLGGAETKGAGSRKTAQLAAACGVDPHWLATGEGEMLPRQVRLSGTNTTEGSAHVVCDASSPAYCPLPGLADALEQLGMALAAVPESMRPALASNLAGWANAGGQQPWQGIVKTLLEAQPTKPRRAA